MVLILEIFQNFIFLGRLYIFLNMGLFFFIIYIIDYCCSFFIFRVGLRQSNNRWNQQRIFFFVYILEINFNNFKLRLFLLKFLGWIRELKKQSCELCLGRISFKNLSNRGLWKFVLVKCYLDIFVFKMCYFCVFWYNI